MRDLPDEVAVCISEYLEYDPVSGKLMWLRKRPGVRDMSQEAGTITSGSSTPYRALVLKGMRLKAHQIAFWIMTGSIPEFIDHKNGYGLDNRWENLRACTKGQNVANASARKTNTSGFKGISFHQGTGKWRAMLRYQGKRINLGLHATPEEASAAYQHKAEEIHGEFAYSRRQVAS